MPIAITSRSRHSRIDQPLSYTKPLKVHVQEFRKLFSDKASLSLFSSFPLVFNHLSLPPNTHLICKFIRIHLNLYINASAPYLKEIESKITEAPSYSSLFSKHKFYFSQSRRSMSLMTHFHLKLIPQVLVLILLSRDALPFHH